MSEYITTVHAHGKPREYADKNKRQRTWSPYQYVPYYLNKGEKLSIYVKENVDGKLFAVTGLPNDPKNMHTYSLVSGYNVLYIKDNGLLSFINNSDNVDVNIEINSSHQRVPYFNLNKTSNSDFKKEMELYINAPHVILSNKLSDIIVSYSSANKHIKNAQMLMENYDVIIDAENKATGVFSSGKADYKLDPNRNLHLETDSGFMYATNEYTGYNAAQGAMPQLLGLSNERFGVWHENGHQRQQFPWQWSGGNGLTEVTTNIYSLFAQEAIFGKASRLDEVAPEIKKFLDDENPNKSYDNQDLFVKLGLFWQLKLSFGDAFYPQLHQLYRLMENTPPTDDTHGQKQLFIRTVSNLVNINLSPFFSRWGIFSDLNTLSAVSFLPTLKNNIWENTSNKYHQLEIPEPQYIPELIYFKNAISNVQIEKNCIRFVIDKDWYSPYDYLFEINKKYIGSISDGQHYYCYSNLTDSGYEITRYFSDHENILENDVFTVSVICHGEHLVHYSSMKINELWTNINNLYTDKNFTALKDNVIQDELDQIWGDYVVVDNDSTIALRNRILFAQQLLLSKVVRKDYLNQYIIEFNNLSFENYHFKAMVNDNVIAELINGRAVNSNITGLLWMIPICIHPELKVNVLVNINGHDTIIKVGFFEASELENTIDALYSHKENQILNDSVNQDELDRVRDSIFNSQLPFWKKRLLENELDTVQRIYLTDTILEVYIQNTQLHVHFNDNTFFREYRYMLFSDKTYLSELSYGNNYYSSFNGTVWTTGIKESSPESLRIEAYANDKWYLVYSGSEETKV